MFLCIIYFVHYSKLYIYIYYLYFRFIYSHNKLSFIIYFYYLRHLFLASNEIINTFNILSSFSLHEFVNCQHLNTFIISIHYSIISPSYIQVKQNGILFWVLFVLVFLVNYWYICTGLFYFSPFVILQCSTLNYSY